MLNQNTNKTHCRRGHEFTEENTYVYRGHRTCKVCKTIWIKDNASRIKNTKAEWAKANPEKVKASSRKTYVKHRESRLARESAKRKENPKPRKSYIDITGQKFGKLTAVRFLRMERSAQGSGKQYFWEFLCDCGFVLEINRSNVTQHKQSCCGRCRTGKYLTVEEALERHMFIQYKAGAERRNKKFELTQEAFSALVRKHCAVCDCPPSRVLRHHKHVYLYTGIDRIDNTLGYVHGNVRPCCKTCNFAKHSMSEDEFQAWINQLVKFRTQPESDATASEKINHVAIR